MAAFCVGLSVAVLATAGIAGGNITKEKLVGKWKVTETPKPTPPGMEMMMEFTRDGKFIVSVKLPKAMLEKLEKLPPQLREKLGIKNGTMKMKGTFMLDGNKIKTTATAPTGKKSNNEGSVRLVNDRELILTDKKGQTTKLQRLKNK